MIAEWTPLCAPVGVLLNERRTYSTLCDGDYWMVQQWTLRVSSDRFLWVHISKDLTWTHHTGHHHKDSGSCSFAGWGGSPWIQEYSATSLLYPLHPGWDTRLLQSPVFCSFYRCTMESILTGCISAWYGYCNDCYTVIVVHKTIKKLNFETWCPCCLVLKVTLGQMAQQPYQPTTCLLA